MESLNTHFPCHTASGKAASHQVHNLATPGVGSAYHVDVLQSNSNQRIQATVPEADVVIVEASINDRGKLNEIAIDTEALVRMLEVRAPAAALVYIEASTRNWDVGMEEHTPPYRNDAGAEHLAVLEYYDIMQLSMMRMLGPLGSRVKNRVLHDAYFMDFGHPGAYAHTLIASVLSFTFREMVNRITEIENEKLMLERWKENKTSSNWKIPFLALPQDWKIHEPQHTIDFTDESVVAKYTSPVPTKGSDTGWKWSTDLPTKPKTLMTDIVDACVLIDLGIEKPVEAIGMVILKSYEHFGDMETTLKCAGGEKLIRTTLRSYWWSHTSQRVPTLIKVPGTAAQVKCKKVLFVCHRYGKHTKKTDSKVKLFSVTVY
jgi:hypothetical protein